MRAPRAAALISLRRSRRERVAAVAFEEDRDRRERLEDVEELFVGRVVGQEVAEVHVTEACGSARERGTAATRDADVLGRVLRRHSAAIELVVEGRDRLAELPESRDRRVLLIVRVDRDLADALRRARQLAGLGLALPEVRPGRVERVVSLLAGLGNDVDDSGRGRPGTR
jgi:hypothetical protein